jgi:DNA-binding MarR family transcriptional regulator
MSWEQPGDGQPGRRGLEAAFEQSVRRMSSYMHLMSQAAAEHIGINATDLNCLNILSLGGQLTAGQLAQHTGLTTASITGVVDRLEQAGYVRRERDRSDRRRVVIHLILEPVVRDVVTAFAPMLAAWKKVADGYTDEELQLILGFQAQTEQVLRDFLARLRQPDDATADNRPPRDNQPPRG